MALTVGVGCLGLTITRMLTSRRLLAQRERLLSQRIDLDARRRRQLADRLHDEALQYLLAARMDLEDIRDRTPPDTQRRLDTALSHASASVRTAIAELQPTELEPSDQQPRCENTCQGDRPPSTPSPYYG